MTLVFGIILLVAAVFLVVAVLLQSGKDYNMSGAIAGGAETFFGKTKGQQADKLLNKLTTVVAILFAVLVLVVYIIQPNTAFNPDKEFDAIEDAEAGDTDAAETEAPETQGQETEAPETQGQETEAAE